jgi:hypothetical protein
VPSHFFKMSKTDVKRYQLSTNVGSYIVEYEVSVTADI